MSGLRDNLEHWALAHGEQVATVVTQRESSARQAIRARRRNRVLVTAATAIAAVVGVVAIASAIPGVQEAPPAQGLSRHLSELVCGEPWVVESGTTQYAEDAGTYFDDPRGDWVLTDDDGETHTDFSGYTAGYGAVSWQGEIGLHGHVTVRERMVAVKLGTIVGVTEEQYAQIRDQGGADLDAYAPSPGACGDTPPGNSSGRVTYHLVLQLSRVGEGGGPVATIVDPGGPLTVDIDGVEAYVAAQRPTEPDLHSPVGDTYQAFVVPRPSAQSCTPYDDMVEAGEPTVGNHLEYTLTIPGVQPLGAEMTDPLVSSTTSLADEWYTHLASWLVVQEGSISESGMAWDDSVHVLAESDDAPAPPAQKSNCVETFEYVMPSGSVFLVIDGIDLDAVNDAYPGASIDFDVAAMQTWVYLGEAS